MNEKDYRQDFIYDAAFASGVAHTGLVGYIGDDEERTRHLAKLVAEIEELMIGYKSVDMGDIKAIRAYARKIHFALISVYERVCEYIFEDDQRETALCRLRDDLEDFLDNYVRPLN